MQRLGENIRLLLLRRHPLELDVSILHRLRDEVVLDVDMLGALGLDSILWGSLTPG